VEQGKEGSADAHLDEDVLLGQVGQVGVKRFRKWSCRALGRIGSPNGAHGNSGEPRNGGCQIFVLHT
jgi:hypothetical protein